MAKERIREKVSDLTEKDKERNITLSYWDFVTLKNLEIQNRELHLQNQKHENTIRELVQAFKEEETAVKVTLYSNHDKDNDNFVVILGKGDVVKEAKKRIESLKKEHAKYASKKVDKINRLEDLNKKKEEKIRRLEFDLKKEKTKKPPYTLCQRFKLWAKSWT